MKERERGGKGGGGAGERGEGEWGERGGKGEGGEGYYLFSPVVPCSHMLSPVAGRCHSLSPVVTRYYPLSPVGTAVTRRQLMSSVVTRRTRRHPLSPNPSPLPSPPHFLENTLITGENLIISGVLFTQKFISWPNIIRFLLFID